MNSYLITPPADAPRLTDLSQQQAIRQVWAFAPYAPACRPLEARNSHPKPEMNDALSLFALRFEPNQRRFRYLDRGEYNEGGHALPRLGAVMASAHALYRLMSVFGQPPLMPPIGEPSVTLWQYPLQHLPTGGFVTLLDDTGEWSLFSPFDEPDAMPRPLADDLLTLLNFLVSSHRSVGPPNAETSDRHTLAGSRTVGPVA